MTVRRALWLLVKYYLAACGAIVIVTLWFERSPWLGFAAIFMLAPALKAEIQHRHQTGGW